MWLPFAQVCRLRIELKINVWHYFQRPLSSRSERQTTAMSVCQTFVLSLEPFTVLQEQHLLQKSITVLKRLFWRLVCL